MSANPDREDRLPAITSDLVMRVGRLEADVSALRADVGEIKGTIKAAFPNFATKADLAQLESRMASMESRLIRWMVGSWMAVAGLMVAVVRYIPHA
jgi:hypothetical protein